MLPKLSYADLFIARADSMDSGTRELVRQRAANCCEYCPLPAEADEWPFHLEHIIAKQHGGNDDLANLCWACSRCNLHKGPILASVDPETGKETSLFRPQVHSWRDHFEFQDGLIIGRTGIGRATARLLDMNNGRRAELRRKLIELGMHPT